MSVWCRCGSIAPGSDGISAGTPEYKAWQAQHGGGLVPDAKRGGYTRIKKPGHRVAFDHYRADCVPHLMGCRQCGAIPDGNKQFYCSNECRTEFEADHFWAQARTAALDRASSYRIARYRYAPHYLRDETFCQRCFEVVGVLWQYDHAEVNHIVPVNGQRENFGCSNHQDNLEALCHSCHVQATGEQRAQGLFARMAS